MNVSANIIRFPTPATLAARPVETPVKPDNVVEFPAWPEDHALDTRAQSHGQLFAAERIVARVAAQLEDIASL